MSTRIKAGEAYYKVSGEGNIQGFLRRQRRHFANFASNVAKIGAGISVAFAGIGAAATKAFLDTRMELSKLSDQTGASVENLSRLQNAAKAMKIDADDVTGAIEELNIRLGEAALESQGAAFDALKQIGLDAKELATLSVPDRLGEIADALNKVQNNASRGFLADEIFGGDAFKIMPLLKEGSQGLRDLAAASDEAGATITTGQVRAAKAINDAWASIRLAISGVLNVIAEQFAPVILAAVDSINPKLAQMRDYLAESGGQKFAAVINYAVKAIAGMVNALRQLRKAYLFVKLGIVSVQFAAVKAMEAILSVINAAIKKMQDVIKKGGEFAGGAAGTILGGAGSFALSPKGGASEVVETAEDFAGALADNLMEEMKKARAEIDDINEAEPFNLDKFVEDWKKRKKELEVPIASGGQPAAMVNNNEAMKEFFKAIAERFKMAAAPLMAPLGDMTSGGTTSSSAAALLGRSASVDEKQLQAMRNSEALLGRIKDALERGGKLVWGK